MSLSLAIAKKVLLTKTVFHRPEQCIHGFFQKDEAIAVQGIQQCLINSGSIVIYEKKSGIMDNIKDNRIYKEEAIRHAVRLDEKERKAATKKEKEAPTSNKFLYIF